MKLERNPLKPKPRPSSSSIRQVYNVDIAMRLYITISRSNGQYIGVFVDV